MHDATKLQRAFSVYGEFGAVAVVGLLHAALLIGFARAAIEHRAAPVADEAAVGAELSARFRLAATHVRLSASAASRARY